MEYSAANVGHIIPVFFFLVGYFTSCAMGQGCWKSEIDKCKMQIAVHEPQANIKYFSRPKLEQFCQAKTIYDSCIGTLLPYCKSAFKLELEGMKKAYDFRCRQAGFETLVKSSECYKKDDVQLKARDCELENQPNVNTGGSQYRSCPVVHQYLNCLRDQVVALCGNEAGTYIYNFTRLTVEPQYQDGSCDLDSGSGVSNGVAKQFLDMNKMFVAILIWIVLKIGTK